MHNALLWPRHGSSAAAATRMAAQLRAAIGAGGGRWRWWSRWASDSARCQDIARFGARPDTARWRAQQARAAATRAGASDPAQRGHRDGGDGDDDNGCDAFILDIDGVLVRGGHRLEQAQRALRRLLHAPTRKHPVLFMTNGGGCFERVKAAQLSAWFDVPVDASQVVLSHTPMAALAERYARELVMVVGRGESVAVAHEYGFKHAVCVSDVARWRPEALPLSRLSSDERFVSRHLDEARIRELLSEERIAAVLVFSDPEDWAREFQLVCDVLASDGGAERAPADEQRVALYFSHGDLLFPSNYHRPRFAQGAFRLALERLYYELTGRPLQYTMFGKPELGQFRYAERMVREQARALRLGPPKRMFMVGDNPAVDIRGANRAGRPWHSVLVRTGVFDGACPPADDDERADFVFPDVGAFVDAVLDGGLRQQQRGGDSGDGGAGAHCATEQSAAGEVAVCAASDESRAPNA